MEDDEVLVFDATAVAATSDDDVAQVAEPVGDVLGPEGMAIEFGDVLVAGPLAPVDVAASSSTDVVPLPAPPMPAPVDVPIGVEDSSV